MRVFRPVAEADLRDPGRLGLAASSSRFWRRLQADLSRVRAIGRLWERSTGKGLEHGSDASRLMGSEAAVNPDAAGNPRRGRTASVPAGRSATWLVVRGRSCGSSPGIPNVCRIYWRRR